MSMENLETSAKTGWHRPLRRPQAVHGTVRDTIEQGTHFRVAGDGPPVILLHGVGLDLEMWTPLAEALQTDYTVIAYDLLGHGHSAKPPGPRTLDGYVRQLEMLYRYLGLERAVVAGFSMGAMVALAFAAQHPRRLAGLTLLNAVYERSPRQRQAVQARLEQAVAEGPSVLIDAALSRWFSDGFRRDRPDAVEAVAARLQGNDPRSFLEAYRLFATADPELPALARQVTCPALVTTGEWDQGSTPDMTQALARTIPDATGTVIGGQKHMMPVEGAAHVASLLRRFLKQVADTESTKGI